MIALVLLVKYFKMLGNWSKIIVVSIICINAIHIITSFLLMDIDADNDDQDQVSDKLFSLAKEIFIFDQMYYVYTIFVFNIVVVKIHFIQLILEATSPE